MPRAAVTVRSAGRWHGRRAVGSVILEVKTDQGHDARDQGRGSNWSAFRSWTAQSTSGAMQWTNAPIAAMLCSEGAREQHAQVVRMPAQYVMRGLWRDVPRLLTCRVR